MIGQRVMSVCFIDFVNLWALHSLLQSLAAAFMAMHDPTVNGFVEIAIQSTTM